MAKNNEENTILLTQKIAQLFREKYKMKRSFLIDSMVKRYVHERSDIDLVVEALAPELYIKTLAGIYDFLPPGEELDIIPFKDAFESLKEKTIRRK